MSVPCQRWCVSVQVLTSAEIRDAMKEAEEQSDSSTQDSATQRQEAASPDLSVAAAQPQGYVDEWLAASRGNQQQSLEMAAADGSASSPAVAASVQHFEAGATDQPAAAPRSSLTVLTSAEQPVPIQPTSRSRLAPLQIDSDPLMPGDDEADHDTFANVSEYSPDTGEARGQPSMPGTAAMTPRARHASALQGATARNQAAIAAHRARLNLKEHSTASGPEHVRKASALASPSASAAQRSSSPRAGSSAGSPRPSLTRFGSVASPSSLRSAQSLSPAAAPRTVLGRGGSVALPSSRRQAQHALSSPRAKSSSPTLQRGLHRGASVTVAQIMKQNSRLPPLDVVPSAPSSPSSALRPLPPLRRGSSVAAPLSPSTPLRRALSLLKRGKAVVPSSSATQDSSEPQGSPPRRSGEHAPGKLDPRPRRKSVLLPADGRRKVTLPPMSPGQTGAGSHVVRGVSGIPHSPNR